MPTIQSIQVEMPSKFSMSVSRGNAGGTQIRLDDLEFVVNNLHMIHVETQTDGTVIVRIIERDIDDGADQND